MRQGIIITSHVSTLGYLRESLPCLDGSPYPIVIKWNSERFNNWELGGIELGSQLFDEFLYLQDTVMIKNLAVLDFIFKELTTVSVSFMKRYNSYLGKYVASVLNTTGIPVIDNKQDAILQEKEWTEKYILAAGSAYTELFPELDGWNLTDKFERGRMIYENDFIKKYKGTWQL